MLIKNNRDKILDVFFNDPSPAGGGFHLRELGRLAGVAPPSVKKYLTELERAGLVLKAKNRAQGYPVYMANRDGEEFRFLKKISMVKAICDSGLLDYLKNAYLPDVIILYGSASRGEDVQGSDVDLFLQCKEKRLDLAGFEKALKRGINIFFHDDFKSISPELKNNLINGIVLSGYLKVF